MGMGTSQNLAVHHALDLHIHGILEGTCDLFLRVLHRDSLAGNPECGAVSRRFGCNCHFRISPCHPADCSAAFSLSFPAAFSTDLTM